MEKFLKKWSLFCNHLYCEIFQLLLLSLFKRHITLSVVHFELILFVVFGVLTKGEIEAEPQNYDIDHKDEYWDNAFSERVFEIRGNYVQQTYCNRA